MAKLETIFDLRVGHRPLVVGSATGAAGDAAADAEQIWGRRALALILAGAAIKLLILSTTKISNCEAYYYVWSRFLSWSYYDHPPMVAWITWLTTRSSHDDFAIRLGPAICSTLFTALVYVLGRRLFGARTGFYSAAILSIVPVFMFVGFVLCPEAPMAPLWVLDLILIEAMRENDEPWRPVLAGAGLGLAFLAKYTAVTLVLVVLSYAVCSPVFRRWLRRPSFYLGGLAAVVMALPVVGWNVVHDWPTLRLHFVERAAPLEWSTLVENFLHVGWVQFGAFHPFVFPVFIFSAWLVIRRARRDDRYMFLACASLPVLALVWSAMLRVEDSESHWPMVGYIPLAIVAGAWLEEVLSRPHAKALDWYIRVCLGGTAAITAFIYAYVQGPALLEYLPSWAYDGDDNFIGELWGWEEVQAAIETEAYKLGPDAVVASSHFTLCSRLMSQMDDSPQIYCPSPRRSHYDFMERRNPPAHLPVVYFNDDRYHEEPWEVMPERNCQFARTVTIERVRVLQHYRVYACKPVERVASAGAGTMIRGASFERR